MGSLRNPEPSGRGTAEPLPSSNWLKRGSLLGDVPVKPATSVCSVGGRCPCAINRCLTTGSKGLNAVVPSGRGNVKPRELLKGSPLGAKNRPFHISAG